MRMAALVALFVVPAFMPAALAQPRPAESPPNRFSALERRLIRDYYGGRSGMDTQHKADPSSKLERWAILPPGAAGHDLPTELAGEMPPLPKGRKRVIVGSCVLLLDTKTRAVLDLLPDAVDVTLDK